MKIAAFTAQTKAIMVTTLAVSAAHTGLALQRRTTTNTSTANGTATSAMRRLPDPLMTLSINCGASGVSRPDSNPPAAIMSRLLRAAVSEAMAWVNALTSISVARPRLARSRL